jgi:hypothetical protein
MPTAKPSETGSAAPPSKECGRLYPALSFSELSRYVDDVREFLPGVERFSWQPARSRTGGTKAVGTGEHAGQVLYGADAEAALAAKDGGAHAGTPETIGEDAAKKLAAGDPETARRFADGASKAAAELAMKPPAPELAGDWQKAAADLAGQPQVKKELGTFIGTFAREREPGLLEKAFRGLVNWLKGLPLATAKLALGVLKKFAVFLMPPPSLSPKRWLPPAAFYVGSLATAAAVMALPVAAVATGLAPFVVGLLAAPVAVGVGVAAGRKLRKKGAELVGANFYPNEYGSGTGRPGSMWYGKIPLKGNFAESARDEVALAGPDGKRAAELLARAKDDGTRLFTDVCEKAVGRLLASGEALQAGTLFDDDELDAIAEGLSRLIASADLLGRARIRRRAELAEQRYAGKFAEIPDDPFHTFDEPVQALPPREAIAFFRRLIPSLSGDPQRYGPRLQRHAFTLAAAADQVLLERVRDAILKNLEEGETATPNVQDLLDDACVSPKNPQYAELVVRTNMMDAYTTGSQAELATPEMQEAFPVWQYAGIRDGRQGKDHEPRFDLYFPSSATFQEVRGPRVWNCRCCPVPIHRLQWPDLQARGAKVEETW